MDWELKNRDDGVEHSCAADCGREVFDEEPLCEVCRIKQEMEDIECFLGSSALVEYEDLAPEQVKALEKRYDDLDRQLYIIQCLDFSKAKWEAIHAQNN